MRFRAAPGSDSFTLFGSDFEGEARFVVERFKALPDGGIRPIRPEASKAKGQRKRSA